MEKVLGLDLGTNSIGFSLLGLEEKNGITTFVKRSAKLGS